MKRLVGLILVMCLLTGCGTGYTSGQEQKLRKYAEDKGGKDIVLQYDKPYEMETGYTLLLPVVKYTDKSGVVVYEDVVHNVAYEKLTDDMLVEDTIRRAFGLEDTYELERVYSSKTGEVRYYATNAIYCNLIFTSSDMRKYNSKGSNRSKEYSWTSNGLVHHDKEFNEAYVREIADGKYEELSLNMEWRTPLQGQGSIAEEVMRLYDIFGDVNGKVTVQFGVLEPFPDSDKTYIDVFQCGNGVDEAYVSGYTKCGAEDGVTGQINVRWSVGIKDFKGMATLEDVEREAVKLAQGYKVGDDLNHEVGVYAFRVYKEK